MKLKRVVFTVIAVLIVGAWSMTLRPQALGGQASYVMVRGTSMLPTYVTGDLIITHKAASYKKGDIVAYRVPKGDFGEGIVVIHRIIGGSAAKGFVIQGDNNGFRDDWFPKPKDMVGKAWVRLPHVGIVLAFLHAPLPMASLAAAIAIVFVLFPDDKKKQKGPMLRQPVMAVLPLLAQITPEPESLSSSPASSPRIAA